MVACVHMSKTLQEKTTYLGTPGKLLEAAGYGGLLMVLVHYRYLHRNCKEIFACVPGHIRYRLPFDACCRLLLHSNLPCGVVRQFLHAFLKRCIL